LASLLSAAGGSERRVNRKDNSLPLSALIL